jgi:hypothetical protein
VLLLAAAAAPAPLTSEVPGAVAAAATASEASAADSTCNRDARETTMQQSQVGNSPNT